VIGLGYIGLPTASMLANNGYDVLGVDVNEEVIKKLSSGDVHIEEPDLEGIFLNAFNSKKIKVSKELEKSDVFIIAVPTPLRDDNKAELKNVVSAIVEISKYIEKNNLVILESTSPPGTTENLVGKMICENTGYVAGRDYMLAFCPERVLPGKIVYELINNKRIIGGINKVSAERARDIYSSFVRSEIFLTDLKTAELVKLVENTYRDINIAFSNELTLISQDYGIDIWEVIKFANMHPRVNILNPGPGVGGHCIPIDPWFILENISRKDTLIEKSRKINNNMPVVIADKIKRIIGSYKDTKVALFGASYKEDIGDTRESPTVAIIKELKKEKIDLRVYDPIADNFKYELSELEASLKDADLLVLLVGHRLFKNIDLGLIADLMRHKNIFDTRNFFDLSVLQIAGFNYYKI